MSRQRSGDSLNGGAKAARSAWRNLVDALTRQGAASANPQTAQRLRAVVLGPRSGGTTRLRASDAFRLAFAVVVVAVSIPVMRATSATELSIVHALNPPPAAIRWLVTGLFWLGSAGVIAFLAVLALLVPRLAAVRRITVAAVLAWEPAFFLAQFSARRAVGHRRASRSGYQLSGHAACGHHRRRGDRAAFPEPLLAPPSVVSHHGSGDRRGHRRLGASGQMLSPAFAIGWGIAARLHLVVGSPLGLPSAEEVAAGLAGLRVIVKRHRARAPDQFWGG
jgi:hypothetical protein